MCVYSIFCWLPRHEIPIVLNTHFPPNSESCVHIVISIYCYLLSFLWKIVTLQPRHEIHRSKNDWLKAHVIEKNEMMSDF